MPFVETNSSCSLPYTAQLMMGCYLEVWESSFQTLSLSEKTAGGCRYNENKCTLRTGWVTQVQKSTAWRASQKVWQETAKSKLNQDTQTASFYSLLAVLRSWQGKQHQLCFPSPVQGGHSFKMLHLLGERGCRTALAGRAGWKGKEKQQWCCCRGGSLKSTDKWHQQLEQSWSAAQIDGDGCSGCSCKP